MIIFNRKKLLLAVYKMLLNNDILVHIASSTAIRYGLAFLYHWGITW